MASFGAVVPAASGGERGEGMRRSGWVRGLLSGAAVALLALPAPAAADRSRSAYSTTVGLPPSGDPPGMDRFGLGYHDRRLHFAGDVDRARAAGFKVTCHSIPVPSSRFGGQLAVDVAHYQTADGGKENPAAVGIISGIHGGFEVGVGAAAQAAAASVRRLMELRAKRLDLIQVLNVNAFGCLAGRRTDENNVDLCRNWASPGDPLFSEANVGYDGLRKVLEPKGEVHHPRLEGGRVVLGILRNLFRTPNLRRNVEDLQQAIAGGQPGSPRGVFYRGKEPAPQVDAVGSLFQAIARLYDGVAVIDEHSGFGPRKVIQVITEDAVSAREAARLVAGVPPDSGIILASDPRAGGIYTPQGTPLSYLRGLLTPAQQEKSLFVAAEAGTVGASLARKLQTIAIMVLENQGWHNGYATPEAEETVTRAAAELFNPSDRAWRAGILGGQEVLLDAIVARYGTPFDG